MNFFDLFYIEFAWMNACFEIVIFLIQLIGWCRQNVSGRCHYILIFLFLLFFNNFIHVFDILVHVIIALHIQYCIEIRSFHPFVDDLLPGRKHFSFDKCFVIMLDRIFYDLHYLFVLIHNFGYPFLFSNRESFARWECFVHKKSSHIKRNTICTYNIAIFISKNVKTLMIYFKPNFINSTVEEVHFIEFIELSNQNHSTFFNSRLKILKNT